MRSASIQALDAGLEHAISCMEDCIDDLDIMYHENLELFAEHERLVQKLAGAKEDVRTIEESFELHGDAPTEDHERRKRASMGIHPETLISRLTREEEPEEELEFEAPEEEPDLELDMPGEEPEEPEAPEGDLEEEPEVDDPVEPGEPNEDPEQDD